MDLQPVLQLYAPLAGLLVFSFALGILWQRVSAVEKAVAKEGDIIPRLIVLEERSKSNSEKLTKIEGSVEGLHREFNELMRTAIHNTVPAVRLSRAKEA